jgi:hypothetical protein
VKPTFYKFNPYYYQVVFSITFARSIIFLASSGLLYFALLYFENPHAAFDGASTDDCEPEARLGKIKWIG